MCPRLVGTAKDVADEMAEIVQSGAADGFVVSPAFLPDTFEDFVGGVVPILQEKGCSASEYAGGTLARPSRHGRRRPGLTHDARIDGGILLASID